MSRYNPLRYFPGDTSTGGGGAWTNDEKAQIRYRLGLDGTGEAPAATPDLFRASSYTAPDNAGIAALQVDTALLISYIKNKKYLEKAGNTWYLKIRNAADSADILNKALKDSNGADITDLAAGTLGQELISSV